MMTLPKFYEKYKNEILISLRAFRLKIKDNRSNFKSIQIIKSNKRDVIRIKDEQALLEEWKNFLS